MVDLIGVPFVNGGRDKDSGLDCWGLVMEVYKRYEVRLPDFVVDAFSFQTIDALAGQEVESRMWEEVHEPQDSDVPLVVLMRIHPELITHAGVLISPNSIIHTMAVTNAIISRKQAVQNRIAGYYRYVQTH